MLSWFLLNISAHAACPDPTLALDSAERDISGFFLADASASLGEAVAGVACGGRPDPEVAARILQAHGMIWYLQEDDRAVAALAASRLASEDTFRHPDLGPKARDEWATASPPGEPVPLAIDGLESADWVTIDAAESTEPHQLVPGLHLLAIGQGDQARFARLVWVDDLPIRLTVGVRAASGPVGGSGFGPGWTVSEPVILGALDRGFIDDALYKAREPLHACHATHAGGRARDVRLRLVIDNKGAVSKAVVPKKWLRDQALGAEDATFRCMTDALEGWNIGAKPRGGGVVVVTYDLRFEGDADAP